MEYLIAFVALCLIKAGKIHHLNGKINEQGLQLIAKGVKISPDTTIRVKKMMDRE